MQALQLNLFSNTVNKVTHRIHLQHLLWFQRNYFQNHPGFYIMADTIQRLEVNLQLVASSSKLEESCSFPCSWHCFAKKHSNKRLSTMLCAVTWPSPAGAGVTLAITACPHPGLGWVCAHKYTGGASTRIKIGAAHLNREKQQADVSQRYQHRL